MSRISATPYTREHHEANIDRLVPEIAQAMDEWMGRDREDWRASNSAAGRLQLLMRSMSAEAAAIQAIDSQEHHWGVKAKREPKKRTRRTPSFDALIAQMNGGTR